MLTGILSANGLSPSFDEVMINLQQLANMPVMPSELDNINLPQVHATNCLKDIFKSSFHGKKAEKHMSSCLRLAANGLQSDM